MRDTCSSCIYRDRFGSEEPCCSCCHAGNGNNDNYVPRPETTVEGYDSSKIVPAGTASGTQIGGSHYQMAIEPVDFIMKNKIPYMEGNVIKYVVRHRSKNGKQDIEKAIHYLQMLLEKYDD